MTQNLAESLITLPEIVQMTRVRHGFFTRGGGSSTGVYASNNCAYGTSDDPANVTRNRDACVQELGLDKLVTVKQRHTNLVVVVEQPWTWDAAPEADAMVTKVPGLALGILTADCAPVLLADAEKGVIAAVHAGWRGAFDGILGAAVTTMKRLGAQPDQIIAAIGPCIAQESYEVGPEFIDRFLEKDPMYRVYFSSRRDNGHANFDLTGFVAMNLAVAGIKMILMDGSDTCADEKRFFSYRRSVLRGESDYGRQLSVIGLRPAS